MKVRQTIRGAVNSILFLCIWAVLIPSTVKAALPEVEQLTGITMDKAALWSPGRLAVGADGTLYVVDSYKNHILKFDRDGKYLGDISFPRVSAIAIAPNGTMYIGSHEDYSVSIVRNGQVIGHLGADRNEFSSIRDIAYDASTGYIYVADNVGNAVRIFDGSGQDVGSLTGVNLPICIEVTADAIYVIDAPVVQDPQQGRTTASRISIFDKTHNLSTTIDDYGKNEMFRPTDIAFANGILYITDAALQGVVYFDPAEKAREIQSIAGPMRPAVSLAISSDGILYVSSSQTQSIQVFAIGGQQ